MLQFNKKNCRVSVKRKIREICVGKEKDRRERYDNVAATFALVHLYFFS